ncbi:NADPH:quinone oxidoreductase family protein [Streptomyces hygroscopicus subsp. hygroscopicus]|uniref:NADPH:quinone oxidoreductase family protein n=1 Tax=Streptomyces hygroscopicus TaxID=1912 RepID=UPI001C661EA9|nr:NADPH:quinone oxidoreductase family protein [Streptomyces hygroscopicus]MBW8092088.1 NADPH:quinone oxidoreductase family protein [Streptomyces hygroscopicus subsp. hygroscopicus]
MQAWRVHDNGEPREVMRLDEVPEPEAGPGQLLVRVRATNVNFPDALLCRGHYQVRPPLPFTPGVELCGEVVAVGEGADGEVGARVLATPTLPAGGFAELVPVAASAALPAPDALDDAEAAALHIGYQTGWFGLHRRARLQPGETLLVHAAAGGVGSAAVQLGKAAGAKVIGVVGGGDKARMARELGCDLVLDRRADDIVAAVKEATAGRGADVVYDPVGGDAFARSVKCVAFEGRIVVVGFASGVVPRAALNHALVKNYAVLGLHWGLYNTHDPAAVRACHEELTKLAAQGTVTPLISERVPLAGAADAVQRVADGVTTGRVVVVPGQAAGGPR